MEDTKKLKVTWTVDPEQELNAKEYFENYVPTPGNELAGEGSDYMDGTAGYVWLPWIAIVSSKDMMYKICEWTGDKDEVRQHTEMIPEFWAVLLSGETDDDLKTKYLNLLNMPDTEENKAQVRCVFPAEY
jgi:hypothetical protein